MNTAGRPRSKRQGVSRAYSGEVWAEASSKAEAKEAGAAAPDQVSVRPTKRASYYCSALILARAEEVSWLVALRKEFS
jgi:hypothetical protein